MNKKSIIVCGPFVGELYWEIFRVNGYIRYLKNKDKDSNFAVMCFKDRTDLWVDIVHPSKIIFVDDYFNWKKGMFQSCWKLYGLTKEVYDGMVSSFHNRFKHRYTISKKIIPNLGKHCNRKQFPQNNLNFNFKVRKENTDVVASLLDNNKRTIILGPRHRRNRYTSARNWGIEKWDELYDLMEPYKKKYNIVIVGKKGEYTPDKKNRYLDVNHINLTENMSLIGVSLSFIQNSSFVIGSQSAIPNIATLLKIKNLQWGHQKRIHTVELNPFNFSGITFIEDTKYNTPPKEIFKIISNKI